MTSSAPPILVSVSNAPFGLSVVVVVTHQTSLQLSNDGLTDMIEKEYRAGDNVNDANEQRAIIIGIKNAGRIMWPTNYYNAFECMRISVFVSWREISTSNWKLPRLNKNIDECESHKP